MNFLHIKNRLLIYFAFSAALLILVAIFYLTYQTERQRLISTSWLLHTHEVLVESERLHSLIKDAQRSQRGYLLTSDSVYLQRYFDFKEAIDEDIQDLQKRTADQPEHQQRLKKIKALVHQSLAYWDSSILILNREGFLAAAKLVQQGIGQDLVDQISVLITEFKDFEQQLLEERLQVFHNSRRLANLMETGGAAASILILLFSFLLLRRLLDKEEKLSSMLEDQVRERTVALQASNEELQKSMHDIALTNLELKRINNDLDNFVYTASHDLRSPVLNLRGLLQLLSNKLQHKLEPKEAYILARMNESTERLNRTVKDLAEVAKIQKEELYRELLSITKVYQDVVQDLESELEATGAQITTNFEVDAIVYPYSHLRSILYNLLSNAVKYHSPKRPPLIQLSAYQQGGAMYLQVTDNGLGLEPAETAKLFNMFKRLHNHVEGSGVGLYMIKRIVENHGGKIEVESIKDIGTTFRVCLENSSASPFSIADKPIPPITLA